MENHDKLYQQFKDAAGKAEGKGFDRMEAVWTRVEEKLDNRKKRRVFPIWQYASIAAILLICLTVGGYIITNDSSSVTAPDALPENEVSTVIDTQKVEEALRPEKVKAEEEVVVVGGPPSSRAVGIQEQGDINLQENDSVYFNKATRFTTSKSIDDSEYYFFTDKIKFEPGKKVETGVSNLGVAEVPTPTKEIQSSEKAGSPQKEKIAVGTNHTIDKSAVETYFESAEKKYSANKEIVLKGNNRVVTVGNGTVEQSPRTSFIQNLEGRVPGIKVETVKPKGNSTVILRGYGAIDKSKSPVIVIDGVVTNSNVFRRVNPNKVQSIKVINEDATSLFGSRAYDGAIIVTTKNLTRKEKRELRKLMKEQEKAKTEFKPVEIKQIPIPQQDTEDYSSFEENKFENPATTPLSTFSIDVDNASYTNIRRFINNGQKVPKDAVRVEEMINFFKYEYGQPKDGTPFAMHTEYAAAPWNPKHKLLKIGLQGKDIPMADLPASNLVFLIDVSGSMNSANKLPLLKQSMKLLINQMRKEDRIAIVVYASASGLVLPSTSGAEKEKIFAALENLSAGGGTAGGEGIELAYKTAQENFIKKGNNRVILATDGDFNVGASSNTDMQTLIEEKRKSGVFLTCLGYGMGNYKDSKMEILANKGNGNYAYIDNMQEADRFLQKEFKGSMFALAKDVKIQIEFNPAHVQSYRLIGYENRKLRDEDFANDAIDAGELGTGHTVTALYEIIPKGVDSEFYKAQTTLKYTAPGQPTANYGSELATIKFRYKKPDEDKSKEIVKVISNIAVLPGNTSADFNFAAAVAWFGLKLRDSDLIPNKKSEDIKALAKKGIKNDPDGYRAEFVRLVEAAH